MIQSMTGYAAASRDLGGAALHIELKGVNARFLDIAFRCPDELRFLEMPLRERIAARIQRGKLDCRVHLSRQVASPREFAPDMALIDRIGRLERAVRAALPDAAPLSVADILRWPGVIGEDAVPPERLLSESLPVIDEVLAEFVASREREGAKLAGMILDRAARLRALVGEAEPLLPAVIADYQSRLAARLREAVASLDEERIRQEAGLFAARIDVAEELSRLIAHLGELERVVGQGGAVGKRLDFLMQELNREANTLASKSVSSDMTRIALEMKLLVEQVREQVQNLE